MERAELDHDRGGAAARGPHESDQVTGLPTRALLERWTRGLGPGTLPVGLVALRLIDTDELRAQHGVRLEMTAVRSAAARLAELVDGAERLVQLARYDFLFVLPSAQPARVAALDREARACVERAEHDYPFVALRAAASSTITRDRPLPIGRLLDEVG
jgi:GGDEF domain-containing protein